MSEFNYKAPTGYRKNGTPSEKTFNMARSLGHSTPPIYSTASIDELKRKYVPGYQFTVLIGDDERRSRRKYTVERQYTHHVSCVDENGFHSSFGYYDLEIDTIPCRKGSGS